MMKTVKINKQTKIVENVSLGASKRKAPEGYIYDIVDGEVRVGPGYTRISKGVYVSNKKPLFEDLIVPKSITRRQCAIELRERGTITPKECLDMIRYGIPPATIQSIFSNLTEEQKILAETDFATDVYLRNNDILNSIMTASGATKEDIDNFYISAAER